MRIPIHVAVPATILAILCPDWFLKFQDRVAKPRGIPIASDDSGATRVHRGFGDACGLILIATLAGLGIGLGQWPGPPRPLVIVALQIVSALIFLLATVYLRGYAFQTYNGQTLIERVDRWIYCTGYFVGTVLVVASLVWPLG